MRGNTSNGRGRSEPSSGDHPVSVLSRLRDALIRRQRPQDEEDLDSNSESSQPDLLSEQVTRELPDHRIGGRSELDDWRAQFPSKESPGEAVLHDPDVTTSADGEASTGPDSANVELGSENAVFDGGSAPLARRRRRRCPSPLVRPGFASPMSCDGAAPPSCQCRSPRVRLPSIGSAITSCSMSSLATNWVSCSRRAETSLDRIVALKLVTAGEWVSDTEVEKFYGEALAAAELDHPSIVTIFEIGRHQGQHFVSMGFVEGQSLDQAAATYRPGVPKRLS